VAKEVDDPEVIGLIRRWLRAGVLTDEGHVPSLAGTPQGSLCAAAHNPPYEQCRVMHSVDPSSLVTTGSGAKRCA
jgi:RNA-directed DNA polymerase